MMSHILLHLAPALAYLVLGLLLSLPIGAEFKHRDRLIRTVFTAGLLCHGFALLKSLHGNDGGLHFGLALALSLTLWLALVLYFIESFRTRLDRILRFACPLAILLTLLPLWWPASIHIPQLSGSLRLHFVVAMLAYSGFTLVALHAVLLTLAERALHRAQLVETQRLPPLLTLEKLLFQLIGFAFAFLTLTLITGLFLPSMDWSRPLTVKYKLGFTLASWLVFGTLLVGRHWRGWRGRTAQRWTVAGLLFLLLAYAGTHFVLEVLLHR